MRDYFDKKGISYGRIIILGMLLFGFLLIFIFGVYFSSDNDFENKNVIKNSDGILINQENGIKTYYLGDGQFKDIIPTVSAQSSPPPGTYIDPPVYPEFMGRVDDGGTFTYGDAYIGGECNGGGCTGSDEMRGIFGFPLTNISRNASINSATFFFFISDTDYISSESIEFRMNNYSSNLAVAFGQGLDIFNNVTNNGGGRHYGILTGTNVSTTGWKNVSLNGNATLTIQNSLGGYFGIGINGSNTTADIENTDHLVTIEYAFNRSYIDITYTVGNGSAITPTLLFDAVARVGLFSPVNETSESMIRIGDDDGAFVSERVGVVTFNLSGIHPNATIDSAFLRVHVVDITSTTIDWIATDTLLVKNISSGYCVNASHVTNRTITDSLFNNITNGSTIGLPVSIGLGYSDMWLGWNNGIPYIQGKLKDGCVSYGLKDNAPTNGQLLFLNSSEGGNAPQLHVTYSLGNCSIPPAVGDWEINRYCVVNNEQAVLAGNIIVSSTGFLNMTGTTNLTFSGSNRYVYVSSGGQINMYNTAGFNKK